MLIDLESGQFPRQLFQTQKSRLPVVHRTPLRPGAIASPKSPTASGCSTKKIEKSTLQLPRNPTVCYCTKNEGTPLEPIREGWDDLLRVAATIDEGWRSATDVPERFGSAARGDRIYRAGHALGQLLRTVYLCDYFTLPTLQAPCPCARKTRGIRPWLEVMTQNDTVRLTQCPENRVQSRLSSEGQSSIAAPASRA